MEHAGHGWFDWINLLIGIVGLIAGAWGIGIGIRSMRDAAVQAQAAQEQARVAREAAEEYNRKLTSINELAVNVANNVQTRAIGRFPENLRQIIKLITDAKKTLLVAADVAAYGQLSNPEESINYYIAIIAAAARGVKVEVLAYSGARADIERRQQFNEYQAQGKPGLEALVREPRWARFVERNRLNPPREFSDVIRSLQYTDLRFRRDLTATGNVPVYEITQPQHTLPVFFWLRDGEEAVFSLFTLGEKSREISFRTVDQSITEILASTFASLRKHAMPTDVTLDLSEYRDLLASATGPTTRSDDARLAVQ